MKCGIGRPFPSRRFNFLAALPRCRQHKLLDRAQEPARDPFLVPDFRTDDHEGRPISHLLIDGLLFSNWDDHPARLVMIVDVEDAE